MYSGRFKKKPRSVSSVYFCKVTGVKPRKTPYGVLHQRAAYPNPPLANPPSTVGAGLPTWRLYASRSSATVTGLN